MPLNRSSSCLKRHRCSANVTKATNTHESVTRTNSRASYEPGYVAGAGSRANHVAPQEAHRQPTIHVAASVGSSPSTPTAPHLSQQIVCRGFALRRVLSTVVMHAPNIRRNRCLATRPSHTNPAMRECLDRQGPFGHGLRMGVVAFVTRRSQDHDSRDICGFADNPSLLQVCQVALDTVVTFFGVVRCQHCVFFGKANQHTARWGTRAVLFWTDRTVVNWVAASTAWCGVRSGTRCAPVRVLGSNRRPSCPSLDLRTSLRKEVPDAKNHDDDDGLVSHISERHLVSRHVDYAGRDPT